MFTLTDKATSCPYASVQRMSTTQLSNGKRRDYWQIVYTPNPIYPPTDLALNVTFSYNLSVSDVNVRSVQFFIFLKKWANHGLFFIYFCLFKHTFQFYNKKCEKMSIQYTDSNSRPLEHESAPITTRQVFSFFYIHIRAPFSKY